MSIGRLEPVPLRTLWPREDADFTHWLAENLDALAEQLNLGLTLEEEEARVGDFMVDLLAKTEDGRLVVIENQLERTDHDHLGKLLTYLTNFDAKIGVWICADPRPEHQRAIQWLNEVAPEDMAFYLVKVEAFRIGDSPPAPWFRIVAGPTPEVRAVGRQRKDLAEREILRQQFWTQLLERARNRTRLHARRKPIISSSRLCYHYIQGKVFGERYHNASSWGYHTKPSLAGTGRGQVGRGYGRVRAHCGPDARFRPACGPDGAPV